jgi:hypothetical protein
MQEVLILFLQPEEGRDLVEYACVPGLGGVDYCAAKLMANIGPYTNVSTNAGPVASGITAS